MYVTFSLLLALFVCVLLVAVVLGWIADVKSMQEHPSRTRGNGRMSSAPPGGPFPFSRSTRSARFASRIHAHRASRGSSRTTSAPVAPPSFDALEEIRHRKILGLQEAATPHSVREAYRRLMLVHHPDRVVGRGPDAEKDAEEMSKQVNEAYLYFRRRLDF